MWLSWTYDRYGNPSPPALGASRTGQSVTHGSGPSNSVSVSTSTNRITGMGGSTFYYDANGNLTQDDLYKYKYDAENRLVELRTLADALVASYAIDGHGLRVVKVWGSDRTFYIYAGGKLISEYEDAASNSYSAGTTPGQAPADSLTTMLYQHSDHLTTRFTTENSGSTSNQQAHYPYGENWYASGGADWSVERKFTSYLKDSETGSGQVHYAMFRQHGARIGRFHMADPVRGRIRNPQTFNRYAYVANDPTNWVDPRGLDRAWYKPPSDWTEDLNYYLPGGGPGGHPNGPGFVPQWDMDAGPGPGGWGGQNKGKRDCEREYEECVRNARTKACERRADEAYEQCRNDCESVRRSVGGERRGWCPESCRKVCSAFSL